MKQREFYIDRIRVVLTVLVILHHTAITYGAPGGWFYVERPQNSILPAVFTGINQAFFMGFFFLLAGYFTPGSLRKKGPAKFLQDRFLRLGIPLLVFGFVLGPLTAAIANEKAVFLNMLRDGRFIAGPLWFAEALLIFSLVFLVWRRFVPEPSDPRSVPKSPAWLLAAVAVGTGALLIRQMYPVGKDFLGLQFGYFSSYIFLFALGCVAAGRGWLVQLTSAQARIWLIISLCTMPVLFGAIVYSRSHGAKGIEVNTGLGFPAVVYAYWEPFVAWGIIATFLTSFRRHFNQASPFWQELGASAYGAYLVHAPVLVGISKSLAGWDAPALVKFAVIGMAAVAASWAIAAALRRLPGFSRVL